MFRLTQFLNYYLSASTFTGNGPAYKSPASDFVSEMLCVQKPMCLTFNMKPPQSASDSVITQLETRVSYKIIDTTNNNVLLSKIASYESGKICISDCPVDTPFDPIRGKCKPCPTGHYADSSMNTCEPCERGTYSDETGLIECIICPSHIPFSHLGSKSVESCVTFGNNLYTINLNNRITKYNSDENTHAIVVEDDGILDLPFSMAFINNNLFMVCNTYDSEVIVYDVKSQYIGKLIEVVTPIAILMFPDDDNKVAVLSDDYPAKVYVYDLSSAVQKNKDGTESIVLRSDVLFESQSINGDVSAFSFGSNFNEVLITTVGGKVFRRCIHVDCDSASINKVMLTSKNADSDLQGITSIPSTGDYLVVNRYPEAIVYRCSITAPINQKLEDTCDEFTRDIYDPGAITIDQAKKIIYVSDYTENVITMFDYEGLNLGNLGSSGSLAGVIELSFRPGHYSPLCPIIQPNESMSNVVGDLITSSVILRDSKNNEITASTAAAPERFAMEATGVITVNGVSIPATLPGSIILPDSTQPHLLSAEISITFAGEFTVTIKETGDAVESHLLGSPFVINVDPSVTDASSCKSSFDSSVIAGDDVEVRIQTFDEYQNPTDYDDDELLGWFGGAEEKKVALSRVFNPSTSIVEYRFIGNTNFAGSFRIHVWHEKSGNEVANSPFFIRVAPAAADALASFHNLETNTLDTSDKVDWILQAYPTDEYGNALSDAMGYSVTLTGFGLEQTFPLEAPTFSSTYSIAKDFEGNIGVSFMYNSAEIKNSPLTISCSSSALAREQNIRILVIVVVSFCAVIFAGAIFFFRYRRDAKIRHYEVVKEKILTKQKAEIDIGLIGEMREKSELLAKATIEEKVIEISKLNEELSQKAHTEEELRIMKAAYNDELREVLVDSKDVKIISLLGKGGFGTVHLATFKGEQVAVKKMKKINRTNVIRFRFECFLLKNLRHPNVVKLVGVCW